MAGHTFETTLDIESELLLNFLSCKVCYVGQNCAAKAVLYQLVKILKDRFWGF